MLKSQVFQYYTEKLWEKIKTTFMSKNDAINGVILDYKWKLVKSSINDVSIFLPSLDDIDEIYIEMSSPDSVILHQVTVKKDGLIPVGSNATSKEILLDGVFDYQTYVTYDVATNKITPSVFEGVTIDSTTSITTSVYVKEHIESDITVPAGSIAYDNITSGIVSEDVQGAIDELKSDVSNITLDAEHTSYNNSVSGLSATNVQGAIDENASIGNQALAIAKRRNQALAYNSYSEMITALDGMTKDELKRGQNIYIGTVGVPDLWVYSVETTKYTYTYTNDETFVNGLNNNVTVQVGYYKLAQLETQKVDVGGINASIEGLQSDVDTLLAKPDNSILWNISDEIYREETNLGISMPSDIGSTISDILDILYLNENIYLLAKNSSGHIVLYKYSGGSWTSCSTNIYVNSNGVSQMQELNGEIYITFSNDSSQFCRLIKYNDSTNTFTTIKNQSTSTGIYTGVLYKNKEDNKLYWFLLQVYNNTNTYTLGYYTYDGTNLSSLVTTSYSVAGAYVVGAYVKQNIAYVKIQVSSTYTTVLIDLINKSYSTYSISYEIKRCSNVRLINDKLYIAGNNILYEIVNGDEKRVLMNVLVNTNYNNSLLIVNSNKKFKEVKLYKIATSYATKDTVIHLYGNHKPLTDNLQAIDNGYKVTQSGEIKVALYK